MAMTMRNSTTLTRGCGCSMWHHFHDHNSELMDVAAAMAAMIAAQAQKAASLQKCYVKIMGDIVRTNLDISLVEFIA
ncbi:hypothetical protein GUJ93_ZPchr0001g31946 [Zizania palustris]|uniref:Uncharacterized protein n=1 Tax=Zizania palustris TaxID=103762 RepID=A0A8J5SAX1_ZIZPA|nr:hypothetical protein GUJ93_ZPchr0001g31946 [Zizania palustris]